MAMNMRWAACSLLALLLAASAGGAAAERQLQGATTASANVTITPTQAIQEAQSLIAEAEGFAKTVVQDANTILNQTEGNVTMQECVELVVSCNATGYDLLQIAQALLAKGAAELDPTSLELYQKVEQLLDSIRTVGPALLSKGQAELQVGAELVQNATEAVNNTGGALVQQGNDLVQGAKELLGGADTITILGQSFKAKDVYGQISQQLTQLGQELSFVGTQINAGNTAAAGRKLLQSSTGDQLAALGAQLVDFGAKLTQHYAGTRNAFTRAPIAAPTAAPTAAQTTASG